MSTTTDLEAAAFEALQRAAAQPTIGLARLTIARSLAQTIVKDHADLQTAAHSLTTIREDSYQIRLAQATERQRDLLHHLARFAYRLWEWRESTRVPATQPLAGLEMSLDEAITRVSIYEPQRICTLGDRHGPTYLEVLFGIVDHLLRSVFTIPDSDNPQPPRDDYTQPVTYGDGRTVAYGVACAEMIVEGITAADLDALKASLTAEARWLAGKAGPIIDERYRQIIGVAGNLNDGDLTAPCDDVIRRSASWFTRATDKRLTSSKIRMAITRGTLVNSIKIKNGNHWLHSVDEVVVRFSEHEDRIMAALEADRLRPASRGATARHEP